MSWFSRAGGGGSWGGRFSPFGRPSNSPNATEVTDGDFSYITNEDLLNVQNKGGRHRSSSRGNAPEIVDWDDKNPDRDTDVLVFKSGRTNYPVHFPVQSIRDGNLRVGMVRQAAAKKIGVSDPKRIRMFFKGKNLKHDERTAREEGLRGDGSGSEILCVVGEAGSGHMAPGADDLGIPQRSYSDGSDDEDDTEGGTDPGTGGRKKPRKRGGKKNRKKNASTTGSSTPAGYSNSAATGAEYLPIPSGYPAPRPTSAPPSNPTRPAAPQGPLEKLKAISDKYYDELLPLCRAFLQNPPAEKDKRSFEHKKLTETILTQIVLKVDGVETEGDPNARAMRKELVNVANTMMSDLDKSAK